jgi:hypothetical protein
LQTFYRNVEGVEVQIEDRTLAAVRHHFDLQTNYISFYLRFSKYLLILYVNILKLMVIHWGDP